MKTAVKFCCTACHCSLDHAHFYGYDPYCDRCAPCPDCARPSRGLGRCATCQACVIESSEQALFLLPRVLGFLQSQGILLAPAHGPEAVARLRKGLPAATCTALLAHQLTHAWQQENCPEQSPQLSEGLACWIERRMYLSLGRKDRADAMVRNPDHIHGDGLRLMLHLEERVGTANLLKKVRTLNDFPVWLRLTTLLGL